MFGRTWLHNTTLAELYGQRHGFFGYVIRSCACLYSPFLLSSLCFLPYGVCSSSSSVLVSQLRPIPISILVGGSGPDILYLFVCYFNSSRPPQISPFVPTWPCHPRTCSWCMLAYACHDAFSATRQRDDGGHADGGRLDLPLFSLPLSFLVL